MQYAERLENSLCDNPATQHPFPARPVRVAGSVVPPTNPPVRPLAGVVAHQQGPTRRVLIEALRRLGCRDIHDVEDTKALSSGPVASNGASRAADLVIVEADEDPLEIIAFVTWLRRHEDSPNRFARVLATLPALDAPLARRLRRAGVNAVLPTGIAEVDLMRHVEVELDRRRLWVFTHTYTGPDRRDRPDPGPQAHPSSRHPGIASEGEGHLVALLPAEPGLTTKALSAQEWTEAQEAQINLLDRVRGKGLWPRENWSQILGGLCLDVARRHESDLATPTANQVYAETVNRLRRSAERLADMAKGRGPDALADAAQALACQLRVAGEDQDGALTLLEALKRVGRNALKEAERP
ncbi:hypothetical protein [Roseospirillum parvum]|uniref:Response regulatory domain-containing protein n=1 Tax=Roseospirillum parvum TaxID=83401 RepID=A0A1G8FAI3_9PROT|nr:hypothetical protein [Roseospirillum parvum]SDH79153.1 hypothetical protein SAMN05421742_11312 [Roseospirillum parvum]